ncbi:MAG: NAD(P)-dependent oxidoreductase, partial [Gaiellaceae bacterium]
MAEIVISEFMDRGAIDEILGGRDVLYDPNLVDDRDSLMSAVADAAALIVRNRTRVDAPLLQAGPRLEVVGRLGVGLDNIDLEACESRGVTVCPATGANDTAVAEYVIGAALILLRGAWFGSERVAAGEWPRGDLIGREASKKRIGLVGFGSIARETARRALALGMVAVAFDPYVGADAAAAHGVELLDLDTLLATSDVVSLHVPLTPETRGLIDAAALARMKQAAILINAAR